MKHLPGTTVIPYPQVFATSQDDTESGTIFSIARIGTRSKNTRYSKKWNKTRKETFGKWCKVAISAPIDQKTRIVVLTFTDIIVNNGKEEKKYSNYTYAIPATWDFPHLENNGNTKRNGGKFISELKKVSGYKCIYTPNWITYKAIHDGNSRKRIQLSNKVKKALGI